MPSKSTTSFFLSSIFVVPWSSLALVGPRFEPAAGRRVVAAAGRRGRGWKYSGLREVLADQLRADHLAVRP